MSIDLRALRSFITVASAGSISRAAETLHIAQPALSLQMKNLELELGVQLLERVPKGIRLTEPGHRLLDHANHLVRQFEIACDDVRDSGTSPRGSVVIGLPQSIAKQLMLPLVQLTLARWPHIRLGITELSTGFVPAQVLAGHLDLGIVFQTEENPALRFEQLVEEDLVVVAKAGQFTRRETARSRALPEIRLSELLALPLIVPAKPHSLRTLIDRYLGADRQPLPILVEVNSVPQLIELIAAGVGCSILSHASVVSEAKAGSLSVARISGVRIQRPVFLVSNTGRPASAATAVVHQALIDLTCDLVRKRRWPARLIPSASSRRQSTA